MSNSYQPGFVLGVNGDLTIRPNLFLDYIAHNVNKPLTGVHTSHGPDKVKKHNPAALVVDGLASYQERSLLGHDSRGLKISDLLYAGIRPEFGINARITLQGNAGVYTRAAAPVEAGALILSQFPRPANSKYPYLDQAPGDLTVQMGCALAAGYYDGDFVPIINDNGMFIMQSTEPEGSHALDIEGRLTIESVEGPTLTEDGALVPGKPASGFFNIPSLQIGHDGIAIGTDLSSENLDDIALTQRPLSLEHLYSLYDISSVLVNDDLVLSNVRWLQDDVSRNLASNTVLPHPGKQASPHIVGGELAGLRGHIYPPLISLYNTTLDCHESLVATGVRFSLTEFPIIASETANLAHNTSTIAFYHRGLPYDGSGFGRVFQLGSQANLMADGITTNSLLSDAFLNVYRSKPTAGATQEAPTTIKCKITTDTEPTVLSSQRSLHSIFLANGSQISLGWPTLEADMSYGPWNLDSTVLNSLSLSDPTNKYGFRFNPVQTGVGELEVAGTPIYIGAGDSDNDAPDKPIPGIDVDGVFYVNHGGKLSVTGTSDLFVGTVIARRVSKDTAYTGQLVLPHDQVYFLAPSGVVQDYDIDLAATNGLTPLYLSNGVMVVNVPDAVSNEDDFGSVK